MVLSELEPSVGFWIAYPEACPIRVEALTLAESWHESKVVLRGMGCSLAF